MKKFYLLALSCLALSGVQAQKRLPRPLAPGVSFGAERPMPVVPLTDRPGMRDAEGRLLRGRALARRLYELDGGAVARPSAGLPSLPDARRQGALRAPLRLNNGSLRMNDNSRRLKDSPSRAYHTNRMSAWQGVPLRAPEADRPLTVDVDTTLCTEYTMVYDSVLYERQTLDYDRYGLRRMMTTYADGEMETPAWQQRYSYEVNDAAFWTKRVIEGTQRPESYAEDDVRDWYEYNTVQRTMDPEGRVLTMTIDDPRLKVHQERTYDYDHVFLDGVPTRGHLVDFKQVRDGESLNYSYAWHEPSQRYVLSLYEDANQRQVADVTPDSVTTTLMEPTTDGSQWNVVRINTEYYGLDGDYCYGWKLYESGAATEGYRTIVKETPDSLVYTVQEYADSLGGWHYTYKRVTNHAVAWQSPRYIERDYAYVDGKWQFTYQLQIDVLSDTDKMRLCLYSYTEGDYQSTSYYGFFPDSDRRVSLEKVDENLYLRQEYPDENTIYHVYYDAQGNVTDAMMWKQEVKTPLGDKPGTVYSMYQLQQDGSWKQGNYSLGIHADGLTYYTDFNDQGYPVRVVAFAWPEGLSIDEAMENPDHEIYYTYTATGYTEEKFTRGVENGVLSSRTTWQQEDDEWVSETARFFLEDGETTDFATREDTWLNNRRAYTWNRADDTFTLDSITARPYVSIPAPGTEITTHYIVLGTRVVPTYRYMTSTWGSMDDGSWGETKTTSFWDGAQEKWVGVESTYGQFERHDFLVNFGRGNVLNLYEDGPDGYADNEPSVPRRLATDGIITYRWDEAAGMFTEDSRTGVFVSVKDDREALEEECDSTGVLQSLYRLDADGRVGRVTYTKVLPDSTVQFSYSLDYTYTPDGFFKTIEYSQDGNSYLENYTFERRTITLNGIDDVTPSAELAIEGLTVSGSGRTIALYDLQGARVASGQGSVTAPRPGIYVVKVGQASAKVVLK